MTDLVRIREQYREGKNALFASLANSGSSQRGIRGMLQKLAKHTDATLKLLWLSADFPKSACLVAISKLII